MQPAIGDLAYSSFTLRLESQLSGSYPSGLSLSAIAQVSGVISSPSRKIVAGTNGASSSRTLYKPSRQVYKGSSGVRTEAKR